jgi:hypothetical protein
MYLTTLAVARIIQFRMIGTRLRAKASSNVEGFPTLRQTPQLPSSGCWGIPFLLLAVGDKGRDWTKRGAKCHPVVAIMWFW